MELLNILLASYVRDSANEYNLLLGIANKKEISLAELYDLYARYLYTVILKIVKQHEIAEEVLQEVFLQVWEKAGKFSQEKGNVYVWLLTLARNKAIDKIRSKAVKNSRKNDDLELCSYQLYNSEKNALDAKISQDEAILVRNALTILKTDQRELLEAAYYEGYSQSELAEKFNLPLGTIKTKMRTALLILREHISKEKE